MAGALTKIETDLPVLPALFVPTPDAAKRYVEFFTANLSNVHTRRAYARAAAAFAAWCSGPAGIAELRDIEPVHVAAYIATLRARLKPPSVKQQLAAIRMLFDWLVIGQQLAANPAAPVRGPKYSIKKGKTPVLTAREARALLDAIDTTTLVGLRDGALIGLMLFTFARVGAATAMRVEDAYVEAGSIRVRLHEKGGKLHAVPCNSILQRYLLAYLDGAGLRADPKGMLFRAALGTTGQLSERPMGQSDAYRMIRRRAAAAGIATLIGNHSFRATGITELLRNGGKLEDAQWMANHESARTTRLYGRRDDDVGLDVRKEPARMLLLDEPTNHLDLDTTLMLQSALQGFEGALIVASHDVEFIEALRPTHRWEWRDGRLVMRQSSMARAARESARVGTVRWEGGIGDTSLNAASGGVPFCG